MGEIATFPRTIQVPVRRVIPVSVGTGFTTESAGTVSVPVVLVIDVDAVIAQLGPRAAGSKSGVSRLAGGKIRVKRKGEPPVLQIEGQPRQKE